MDRLKLEYEIKRSGMTISDVCEKINMSRSAFYRKSRGMTDFTQSEIMDLINLLHLQDPMSIFFNEEVS